MNSINAFFYCAEIKKKYLKHKEEKNYLKKYIMDVCLNKILYELILHN
jgi:hypothetical protein